MHDLHAIGWYASRISPHLPKEAFKVAPERLWASLAYLSLVVVGMAAVSLLDLPLLLNVAIALLIGQGFAGLGFLGHEILHGTVVKSARIRDFLGAVCFAPFSLGSKLWRKWHNMQHHAHTQDEDSDPDAWATMERLFQRPFIRVIYRLHPAVRSFFTFLSYTLFFSIHSLIILKRYYKEFRPQERSYVLMGYLAPTAFWIGLLLLIGPYKWLFAYLIPVMIANFVVISYISTNHQLNPLTKVNDPLANSLSVIVPRWVDLLHLNFSHHTEHHLFPGMNPKWAPLVKAQVKRLWPDRYHEMSMGQALAALWQTPRIYMAPNSLGDPDRMLSFGSLGHGLAAGSVHGRPFQVPTGLGQAGNFSEGVEK